MTQRDHRNHPVTGATPSAIEPFEAALAMLQCYRGDPLAAVDRAILEAPGFAMARCLKAYLGILSTERSGTELAKTELESLESLTLDAREAGHRVAIRAFCAGDWQGGIRALDAVLAEHPLDALALQAAHVSCFFAGDSRNLRDGVARVRGAWSASVPGYHAVVGMHAFGLEECGDYARAEREGRHATELEPHDAWAHHAVAHVLEMQGRLEEGISWMTSREPFWSADNFFAIHNYWHLALHHLDRGETARVLELYDTKIRATGSGVAVDLIDASSLLWRLHLRGVELGERFSELAEAWLPLLKDASYAFNDAHAAMAFIGAGRRDLLGELVESLGAQAQSGAGSNREMAREVGAPLVRALIAFADGDAAGATDTLFRIRPIAARFGGSHAQRDLIDLTLAEAALRAGKHALALAIARERDELRPGHPSVQWIRARAVSPA